MDFWRIFKDFSDQFMEIYDAIRLKLRLSKYPIKFEGFFDIFYSIQICKFEEFFKEFCCQWIEIDETDEIDRIFKVILMSIY